jgi:hypothetical protein
VYCVANGTCFTSKSTVGGPGYEGAYYSGTSVHERPCSRTNFPSKKSRMTNGVSDYEHASWQ